MKKIYITGSSRGLGKALAEKYLETGDLVVGMSRSCSISAKNYKHHTIDLSDPKAVASFKFDLEGDYGAVILINNAGTLGDIKHIGEIDSESIAKAIQLNVSSPMMLANQFAAAKCNQNCKKYVLNIGSGASTNAVDGWGVYCASKAAIDMFNMVFEVESKRKNKNTQMKTIAPGIIDTAMQAEIRGSNPEQFFEVMRFINYKDENELATPKEVAKKIVRNFETIFKNENTIQSIRNY